ncbi:hypothetical protein JAAARDRAFT_212312 [Jaapia argillacea MUCL 33604]|uniref:Uncharacterized protein n=1 Tax=Jaapia argillacea MUCL 33604 TaxID=933084 RepID=A0A067P333_9AGAM|nr:hypothetical protein JAAARDRAFT_212312 [Jaapia argillacea MUCL 33604]
MSFPINNQPSPPASMDLYYTSSEKGLHDLRSHCQCQNHSQVHTDSHSHHSCHQSRFWRILFPALLSLFGLVALSVFALIQYPALGSLLGLDDGEFYTGLAKRAVGDTTGNQSTFASHKLYLIVIFVGLVVVLVLGVMLSFWCCKGSFENPLCCPCYLCACCGGLACLECIGCGLCAEGFEQM